MFRNVTLLVSSRAVAAVLGLTAKAAAATGQATFRGAAYCQPHSLYPRIVGYPQPMSRTPGFSDYFTVGGATDPNSFAPSAPVYQKRYSAQWLFFRVIAFTLDSTGWHRHDGRWLAGLGEMGPQTSGLFQFVETAPNSGTYRPTGLINSRSPEDMSFLSVSHGSYYLMKQFYWGTITDLQTGRIVYGGDQAYLDGGWTNC